MRVPASTDKEALAALPTAGTGEGFSHRSDGRAREQQHGCSLDYLVGKQRRRDAEAGASITSAREWPLNEPDSAWA
jgi:hypothetical protein